MKHIKYILKECAIRKSALKSFAIISAVALAHPAVASASDYGYCTDVVQRANIFRMGDTETQGLAIRLDGSKLSMLRGRSITAIKTAFGSMRTTDGTVRLFVSTTPDGTALVEQTVAIPSAVKWVEFPLDAPYTITGEEEQLYIGYTAEINTKSSMLMADFTADALGCSYVYNNGAWVDTYGVGCGSASIRVCLDDAQPVTDLMIKPCPATGYYKAEQQYTLGTQIYNFGDNEVHSFDAVVTVGDGVPSRLSYTDVALAQGQVFDITLPSFGTDRSGDLPLSVEIVNVNGADDSDAADNAFVTGLFFYPASMERSILLEGFTGQECSNCPTGHSTIHNFLETVSDTEIIEVMHHAGYAPDFMSMDADLDYTYYYGSTSTYAPAVMLNRTVFPRIGAVPVMGVSSANLTSAYSTLLDTQPYVSLALETSYDPATRLVEVNVQSLTHTDLPSDNNILNVMLVQNGIIHSQKPYGDGYTHNAVFRGTLTDNPWGLLLGDASCAEGGTAHWSTSFTLPEAIFSDYWATAGVTEEQKPVFSIPTVAENMYIVAYIGAFDSGDVTGHSIYNAVQAPLGASHVQGGYASLPSIGTDSADGPAITVVGRRVQAIGDVDSLEIVTLDGRRIDASASLMPGVYVVRATRGSHTAVKKIIIH